MNAEDGERRLGLLNHMEHETVRLYDAALSKVSDGSVRTDLQAFRDDHDRHAKELDDITERQGVRHWGPSGQFSACMKEHLQVIQRARSQDEALEGLLLVEEANLGEVRRGTHEGAPMGADDLLRRMLAAEERDVTAIASAMRQQVGISGAARHAESGRGAWRMSDQELFVMLSGLRFLDEQTALALEAGATKAADPRVQGQLQQFAEDHRRHMRHVDEALEPMGGAELPSEELQQYLHEAVASIDRARDVDDATDRLLLIERANAAEYGSMARAQIDDDAAMRLLERHHLDEQHHVLWLEEHSPVGAAYGTTSAPGIGEDPGRVGV
jgi:rubrerythrin